MQPQSNTGVITGGGFNQLPEVEAPAPEVEVEEKETLPVEEVPVEEPESSEESPTEVAAQEEARKHGWVPKDEWRGAPDRWRPATEFLDVRNNISRIASEENATLRAKVAAMEMREAEREKREQDARNTLERERLRLQMKEARENQDWDRVDEITEKMFDLKVSAVTAPKGPDPATNTIIRDEFLRFKAQNKWLEDSKLSANFMIELDPIARLNAVPNATAAFELAKERVMRLYPERFRSAGAPRHSMAEMGGTTGPGTNGRSWADLKPDVRKQAEADIAAKRYTKADFLANCEAEHFRR